MAKQVIEIGSTANDGTGDQLRDAFDKSNQNFTELYDNKVDKTLAEIVSNKSLKNYSLIHTTPAINVGVVNIDFSLGNSFDVVLSEDITSIVFASPAAAGLYAKYVIEFVQDATGTRTVAWPASITWPGGVAPIISSVANEADVITLTTRDGGVTYRGTFEQNFV